MRRFRLVRHGEHVADGVLFEGELCALSKRSGLVCIDIYEFGQITRVYKSNNGYVIEWIDPSEPDPVLSEDQNSPKTCREAAERFRQWANQAYSTRDCYRLNGQAGILEMFGDAPVPEALLKAYDFSK